MVSVRESLTGGFFWIKKLGHLIEPLLYLLRCQARRRHLSPPRLSNFPVTKDFEWYGSVGDETVGTDATHLLAYVFEIHAIHEQWDWVIHESVVIIREPFIGGFGGHVKVYGV